jgi:RNA polymerase sigma-70 factor (ECF subfamily)
MTAMVMPNEVDPEQPVIDAICGGDPYAFGELVRRHDRWVRGVVFGVLGHSDRQDDVVQQVWTTMWERIGKLRDPSRWRPWLYRIARNAALDAGREITRRRDRMKLGTPELLEKPAERTTGSTVAEKDQHADVLRAIQALPALYREPFVLRHLNDWTYKEIADVMGMPVDSVETRLVRARRMLRESLKDKVV